MSVPLDTPGPGGRVLTVGAGMEFANLSEAIDVAQDNDVIAVQAGTYTDASSYTHRNIITAKNVTIEGVGGMVHLQMGSQGIANGKALLVVENGLTLKNFELSGANDGNVDGNLSGIRLEGGNLNVSNCYIHDNEEGILGGVPGTTVNITNSEFANNGSGDGYSHNIYIGPVDSFTLTNSYMHGAKVGHEVKSRAAVTNISNNVIADGPTGTASYDIDIPNAGVANITNNIIEKGPNASNSPVIHYGGETQLSHPVNSLTVSGNTIVGDYGPNGIVILNASPINGLSTVASLTGNRIYGFDPARYGFGAVNASGNTVPATEPAIPTASPWAGAPVIAPPAGSLTLNLTSQGHVVLGGTVPLTVNDIAGGNTIDSGTGAGVTVVATGVYSTINTSAGTANSITVQDRNTIVSAGNDLIGVNGVYDNVTATGVSVINSGNAAWSSFTLGGRETLNIAAGGIVTVTGAGAAVIDNTGGYTQITKQAGGTATINEVVAGGSAAAILSGGADYVVASGNGIAVTETDSAAHRITISSGNVTVNAGTGADTFVLAAVGSNVGGSVVINGFQSGVDQLTTGPGVSIAGTVVNSNGQTVTLSDGRQVQLIGGAIAQAETLTVGSQGQTISRGDAPAIINDTVGSNTIVGGAGGITLSAAGTQEYVKTTAGSHNSITLTADRSQVVSNGVDTITSSGLYNTVTANGQATVVSEAWGNTILNGQDLLTSTNDDAAWIGASGAATINVTGGFVTATKAAGGVLTFTNSSAAQAATATVSGGDATVLGLGGTYGANRITTGGAGSNVVLGTGSTIVYGGTGQDSVSFGSGNATVIAGSGADVFTFASGAVGNDVIYGFKSGLDKAQIQNGGVSTSVKSQTVYGSDTYVTLTDGTHIQFAGAASVNLT